MNRFSESSTASSSARITALHLYPIKSCAAVKVAEGIIGPTGFLYDRNWVLLDRTGAFVTQRKGNEAMALIRAVPGELGLRIEAPSMETLVVPMTPARSEDKARSFRIWAHERSGWDEGDCASEWFSTYLRKEGVRLVRIDDSAKRGWAAQDGGQYLVVSRESLDALNEVRWERGLDPVGMNRFRSNIEIEGLGPFGEDRVRTLELHEGRIKFELGERCGRCGIVNIDQERGVVDSVKKDAALAILGTFRRDGKDIYFGRRAKSSSLGGVIRIGDLVVAREG